MFSRNYFTEVFDNPEGRQASEMGRAARKQGRSLPLN